MKKDAFKWNKEATQAFIFLEHVITTTAVIGCLVESDASGGIGALLMQEGRLIAYPSRHSPHIGLLVFHKKMLAIVNAITRWWPYLIGQRKQPITKACNIFLSRAFFFIAEKVDN